LVQAQAGTLTSVAATPETAVPKDASGMTGAAIIPSGTDAQRAAISPLVAGMLRFNTDYTPDSLEVYDLSSTTWRRIAYTAPSPVYPDLVVSANGTLNGGTYRNVTINPGVTATVTGLCYIKATGTVTINGNITGDGGGSRGTYIDAGNGGSQNNSGQGVGFGTLGVAACMDFGLGNVILPYSWRQLQGSSGAPGGINAGGGTFARSIGGSSGAALVIVASGNIVVSGASTLSVNGTNGGVTNSGANVGAGGGGSGGIIVLETASTLTLAAGSTLSVSGGNGANGEGGGGGGGAGGGGYVVLNSPTLANSATINLSVGVAGAGGGGSPGGGGGAFGGEGGLGGQCGTNPAGGTNGQLILNEYI